MGTITAIAWFSRDSGKYVRSIWDKTSNNDMWGKEILINPFANSGKSNMIPLIKPGVLRQFLIEEIVEKGTHWNNLYPSESHPISSVFDRISLDDQSRDDRNSTNKELWDGFINRLKHCKPLVLYVQRSYINENLSDFNQLESLEDTNAPWDWDHIYPQSWVYYKKNIPHIIGSWYNSIGNLRAVALEINRSENNNAAPCDRLLNRLAESFVKDNDWKYWNRIAQRISIDEAPILSQAILNRLVNIYQDWYNELKIESLFEWTVSVENEKASKTLAKYNEF